MKVQSDRKKSSKSSRTSPTRAGGLKVDDELIEELEEMYEQ